MNSEPVRSKWLAFEQTTGTAKTERWLVKSKSSGDVLGEIRWFGRWRCYSFYPESETIFNAGCLLDIGIVCHVLTKDHTKTRQERQRLARQASGALRDASGEAETEQSVEE